MKPALLTLLILIGSLLSAQDICPCVHKLDTLIVIVSRDYAGYHEKFAADRTRYNTFVDSLRKKAPAAVEEQACTELREAYCAYFKDKRLRMFSTPEIAAKRNITDPRPLMTGWTADSLRNYFDERADELHEMEGIWKFGEHELGLVYLDTVGRYQAVNIRSPFSQWKEGMVKFNLTLSGPDSAQIDYWRGEMTFMRFKSFRSAGHLSLGELGVLHRTFPENPDTLSSKAFELAHGNEVQWRMVDDSTLYIKIGSCQPWNQVIIDSIVKANAAMLERVPAWIIDVRRNWAGQADVFRSLMPYLSTRAYKDPGFKYWISPANTAMWRSSAGSGNRDRKAQRALDRWIRYSEKHPNTWTGSNYRPLQTVSDRLVPRRIAMLADTFTAGRAELFLIEARGSSERTIIVGQTTAGAVDYGNVVSRWLEKDEVFLLLPTSRRNWLGQGLSYDSTGVRPDVLVGPEETDHIGFVLRYWKSH